MRKKDLIEELVINVVDDFLMRVDPAEKRWPTGVLIDLLRKDLYEAIDGAIADWEVENDPERIDLQPARRRQDAS